MKLAQRTRGIVQAIAVVLSLALPLMLAISAADARIGGGGSSGSRGTRTFSAPPSTSTAPSAAQPFNRTMTQPGRPAWRRPNRRRLLQPAGNGHAGRPRRRLPRRRSARDAVWRRTVRRPRRTIVDLRPDPADRPDRHCRPACDVVVAAPQRDRVSLCRIRPRTCAVWSQPVRTDQFPNWHRVWAGIRQRAARDRPERLRSLRAPARRNPGGMVERGHRQASHAGDAGNGVVLHQGPCRKRCSRRRQQGLQTSSCCRAISRKPGGKAIPTMPAWRCGSR